MGIEIRIYEPPTAASPHFKRVGITSRASRISMTESFYGPGAFEIELPFGTLYADQLKKYNLVFIGQYFWGIIRSVSISALKDAETITVSGLDLNGLLSSRPTVPPQFTDVVGALGYDPAVGSSETVMKQFVAHNVIESLQPMRNITGFVIAPDLGRGIPDDKYMTRFEFLSEVLQKIGENARLGWKITPDLDAHSFIFDVLEGVDRTYGQHVNPRIVFSPGRGTVEAQDYINSDAAMRNVFYTTRSGAEFADEALTVMYTREGEDEPEGIYRWEQHLTVSAETPEAGEEYNELRRQALIEAENYRTDESFTCRTLDTRHRYGRDYFLGDFVTVQNLEWGISSDMQITGAAHEIDSSGVKLTLTFGRSPLNVFGRIMRQIRNK